MYPAHFGLSERPFAITPDPRFVFLSPSHREALAHLLYGLGEGGGFVQLTGEVGTGKTTVCRTLLHQLPDNVDLALVFNPQLTVDELLRNVCEELHIALPTGTLSTKELMDRLYAHLLDANARGRRTVLIIDEAQNLSAELLEAVRLLTNLETDDSKLLQVFLIGQPELRARLARKDLRQLAQRITARYHLNALTLEETCRYVRHRLAVAGAERELFTASALRQVYRLSRGIPRLINILCDRAMLGGYANDRQIISPAIVRRAHKELHGLDQRTTAGPLGHAARRALLLAGLVVAVGAAARPDLARGVVDWAMALQLPQPAAVPVAQMPGPPAVASKVLPGAATAQAVRAATAIGEVAVTRTGSAPAAAPSRTLEALLPDVVGDADRAAITLAGVWGGAATLQDSDLCGWAARHGLACHDEPAGWPQLLGVGLPAVLELDAGGGRTVHGLLRSVHDGMTVLELDGTAHHVSEGEVSRLWTGQSVLLWRPPATELGVLAPGQRGASVEWVRRRLTALDGEEPSVQSSERFDRTLQERVMAFQRSNGLVVDGIIGPETLGVLDQVVPVPRAPSLSDPVPASSPRPASAAVAMGNP